MEETVGEQEPDLVMDHYSVTVRRFIRNYYAQRAASCFEHESRTTGQVVRGTVVVSFTIGPDGHAQNATVSRNTTGSASLGQCLQRNVAGWELPVPPNREPIDMEMPFSR
jgi:outer membrane biosynthesis protein TonB